MRRSIPIAHCCSEEERFRGECREPSAICFRILAVEVLDAGALSQVFQP